MKNEVGELRLTVPVLKKGRGLQVIRRVEIQNDKNWRKKHLESIRHNYVHAPYFSDYFSIVETIYERRHLLLIDLNVDLIKFFFDALSVTTRLVRQSELGVVGTGTDLLVKLADRVGADRLLVFSMVEKYIDLNAMRKHAVETVHANFRPPVYPQLWGNFVYNLSTLDLLLNCGPQSNRILQ